MKKHVENWRKFLKEEKENYIIFEDMDGCLVDFITPILQRINYTLENLDKFQDKELLSLAHQIKQKVGNRKIVLRDIKEEGPKVIHTFLFKVIEDDVDFWATLQWKNDGKELWNYITSNFKNVYILSTPARGKGKNASIKGKEIWIKNNLPNISLDKCIFLSEKYKYASPNSILIDDYNKNTNEWESHGGIAILHISSKDTIEKLNNLLKTKS